MKIFLRLRNRGLYETLNCTLALAEICEEMAAGRSEGSPERLKKFKSCIASAKLRLRNKAQAEICVPLENAGDWLEKACSDINLHSVIVSPVETEALSLIKEALLKAAAVIHGRAPKTALVAARLTLAEAQKTLTAARRSVGGEPMDTGERPGNTFIANLKFSRIYSTLENCISAVEDYAEILARAL